MYEKLEVGSSVVFTDKHFVDRVALVTAIWGSPNWRKDVETHGTDSLPCINLIFVSGDSAKDDPYGRQMERETSVVHATSSSAGGCCWRMTGEPRPAMGTVEK